MDDLEPLNIEFIINNPEIISQAKEAEAALQTLNDTLQSKALAATNIVATNAKNTIDKLKAELADVTLNRDFTPTGNVDKLIAYNKQIEQLKADISQVSNIGREGFDELGNALPINKMGKFEAAINRVTDAQNIGARVVTQFTRQIISLGVGLISGIFGAKAIEAIFSYLSSLNLFTEKLSETQRILQLTEEAIKSTDYSKAVSSVVELTENIQLAKKGFLDKSEVLNEYNKELGKSLGYTNDLNTAEQLIVEKGQAYIKLTLLKATAQAALNDATKKQLEYEKTLQSNTNPEDSQNDKNDQSGFKNLTVWERLVAAFTQDNGVTQKLLEEGKTRALKTAGDERDGLLKIYKNIEEEAAKLAKENHIDFFNGKEDPKTDGALQAALNARQSILEKIDAIEKEYARKSLDTNEQQIQAIKDKFTTLRAEIDKANAVIDRENAKIKDPTKRVARVDGSVLGSVEDNAITNQLGIQDFEYYKTDLDKQKKLFDDFEAYKLKVGTEKANARFSADLNGNQSYIEYLQKELSNDRIDPNDKSEGTAKRKELLLQQLQQALAAQKENFTKLLESVQTYETQRANLTATYQDKRKALIAGGYTEEADLLDEQYKEQIGKLDDANFEKLASVKELYSGITNLSANASKKLIADVQSELNARIAAGAITSAEAKKVQDLIDKSQNALNLRTPEGLIKAGEYITKLGDSLNGINSNLAAFVSQTGSTISAIGQIGKQFAQLQSDIKNGENTFADYANIVIVGLTSIFNIISSITSASAERKKSAEEYYNSVIEFQNQYNIALDEQIRLQYQTDGNIFSADYSKQIKDAADSYKKASEQYQQSLQDIQKGQAKVGQKNAVDGSKVVSGAENGAIAGVVAGTLVAGPVGAIVGGVGGAIVGALSGLFGGKKKADVFAPLLQAYPDLIQANGKFNESLAKTLISTNQVSDATKTLLQNTINYYDEEQTSIDQITSALSSLASNLGSNLENALVQAFESGDSAATAFGNTVSDVIGNIIQQFLFEDIFGSEFDKLNTKLKATVLGGGSTADITSDFIDFFKEAGPLAQNFTEGLKAAQDAGAAQGITLFPSTTSGSNAGAGAGGISGAVKGVTETQANALEGAIRGMQLAVVQTNGLLETGNQTIQEQLSEMKNQTLLQMQIVANTKRTADNTDDMKVSLKNIDKNTSDTAGNVLRAAGIV